MQEEWIVKIDVYSFLFYVFVPISVVILAGMIGFYLCNVICFKMLRMTKTRDNSTHLLYLHFASAAAMALAAFLYCFLEYGLPSIYVPLTLFTIGFITTRILMKK